MLESTCVSLFMIAANCALAPSGIVITASAGMSAEASATPEAISFCSALPRLPFVVVLGVAFGVALFCLMMSFGFVFRFLGAVEGESGSGTVSITSGIFLLRLVSEFIWPVIRPLGKYRMQIFTFP